MIREMLKEFIVGLEKTVERCEDESAVEYSMTGTVIEVTESLRHTAPGKADAVHKLLENVIFKLSLAISMLDQDRVIKIKVKKEGGKVIHTATMDGEDLKPPQPLDVEKILDENGLSVLKDRMDDVEWVREVIESRLMHKYDEDLAKLLASL